MESTLALLRDFVLDHPELAGLTVFAIAFFESLALVGLLLPGVAFMFAAGALVGMGVLPFWGTLLWATFGAFCGDLVSFWLGRRLEHRVFGWRWFQNHHQLLERGIAFFRRYGWLSLLLGRFVGPLRPFLPLIAGIFEMPWPAFLTVAAFAAALWAPAYLLPGMLVGTTLGRALATTGHLLLAASLLLLGVFLLLWLFWKLLRALHARRRWALVMAPLLLSLSLLGWGAWNRLPKPRAFLWQAERGEIDRQLRALGFLPPPEGLPWLDGKRGLYLDLARRRLLWLRPGEGGVVVKLRPLDPRREQREVEGAFLRALSEAGWCFREREIFHCPSR